MLLPQLFNALLESKTISPSYKLPHIIYTLMLLGQSQQGLGRYRIKKDVGLGEGSIKTLLNRFKDQKLIFVEEKRQIGHILTEQGKIVLNKILEIMTIPKPIDNANNSFVVGKFASFSKVNHKKINPNVKIGITQRDEGIKIGGTGASCLIFEENKFLFPDKIEIDLPINRNSLVFGDLIVIGGGDTLNLANLATIAASLSLIQINS